MKFETINNQLCRMVEPEPKESPIDPIERPLRNLILEAKEKGVNIRTWYQDLIFTPESLTSYLGNGKYRWWNIGNWELTKRKANMPMPEPEPHREPEYVICKRCAGTQSVPNPVVSNTAYTTCPKCGGTGYEIEPEPAFKAGDWVTDGAVQGRMVTRTSDTTWVEVQDGKQYHIETSHLRKLKPSEVIVNIGCLSGPVRRSSSSHFCIICGDHWSMIAFAMLLDTPTRELVESLLKAQEVNNG